MFDICLVVCCFDKFLFCLLIIDVKYLKSLKISCSWCSICRSQNFINFPFFYWVFENFLVDLLLAITLKISVLAFFSVFAFKNGNSSKPNLVDRSSPLSSFGSYPFGHERFGLFFYPYHSRSNL